MALQLLVFDTRRGNKEGEEDDKVLAGFPDSIPPQQQSGLVGLLQGLLLFAANFTAAQRPRWDVAETDGGTWVMHEVEPHLWFAALAPRDWLPRHTTERTLRCLLTQMHLLTTALCGSVQSMLDQNPSGRLARAGLHAVVDHVGQQLCSPHSWQHRELRNPLGDTSLPPLLQLSSGTAVSVQSLGNSLLLASLGGRPPVQGMLLLYGPYLLWSTLAPRDTAAVFALLATGLLHASSKSRSGKHANGSHAGSPSGGVHSPGGGAATPVRPALRVLHGSWWQQLPSGFLVQQGGEDAAPVQEAAPAVPLVHLQHGPMGQEEGREQEVGGGRGQRVGTYHLLPLLEGRLLVVLLLGGDTQLNAQLLGGLHSLVAGPAKLLAAQIGEEVRASRVEASHLPGFRYLFQDQQQKVARASPRIKVSSMSHHARTLAAVVRESLGAVPQEAVAEGQDQATAERDATPGVARAPEALLATTCFAQHPDRRPPRPIGGSSSACDSWEVLEVMAKSSQDCWAFATQPGGGRRLLAVRERRTERDLPEAAGVLQAFAEANFLI